MSWHPAPEGYDARTPITVMVTPAQLMRIELYLAQVRETHPTADDNAVTDLIFSRGLDAAMEKPMESITPEPPQTVSKDDIAADRLYREGGGRFLQLGIGRNLADLLARTHKACCEKSPHYAEDSLLRHALECGLSDIAAGMRDLQEYPQTGPDDARPTTAETDTTPPGFVRHALHMPIELHPTTQDLVRNFAEALASKLNDAQQKHGWTDDWTKANGLPLQAALMEHVSKGDPRDVAAYCAFLWASKLPTSPVGYISSDKHETAMRAAQHRADMEHWRSDIERLTDQLEAARCQSVQAAVAVLQNAMTETGASVTIDQHPQAEVVYASGTESIRVPPAELPEVIESLECLQRYQRRCGDWDREITSLDYELLAGCRRPTTETPEV